MVEDCETNENKLNRKIDNLSEKVDSLYERSLTFYHKEAINRMDHMYERFETKIDALGTTLKEDSKSIQAALVKRLDTIETDLSGIDDRVFDSAHKITKHETNFGILNFLITGGLGTLLALSAWFSGLFHGNINRH